MLDVGGWSRPSPNRFTHRLVPVTIAEDVVQCPRVAVDCGQGIMYNKYNAK